MILTSVIDHLYRLAHDLATKPHDLPVTVAEEQIAAAKTIIEKISKLKYEMGREKPLLYDSVVNYLLYRQCEAKVFTFHVGLLLMMVNPPSDCSTKSWPPWKYKERAPGLPFLGCTQSQWPSHAVR